MLLYADETSLVRQCQQEAASRLEP
ncbi:hypothetical protein CORC01_10214 [Colletotrichum orchidophilum]|uniref:Uncharacterized protein n=1 Tax=Colletotrichum orchidophilum TaxID=1209926 RepID=A0A1G4AZB8_9PEZI|nr:hypothetical protein CORC01_10214 [Colletotrichum orchidophilum]